MLNEGEVVGIHDPVRQQPAYILDLVRCRPGGGAHHDDGGLAEAQLPCSDQDADRVSPWPIFLRASRLYPADQGNVTLRSERTEAHRDAGRTCAAADARSGTSQCQI